MVVIRASLRAVLLTRPVRMEPPELMGGMWEPMDLRAALVATGTAQVEEQGE
jgi:hypothetical protein